MTAPLDIPHYVKQIELLDGWVSTYPLTKEFREKTTYRQFHELLKAKQAELGLTREVWLQLSEIEGDSDLDSAWMEYGMTLDHRELVCPTYMLDLPLNAYWMDEYEPTLKAVDDYIEQQPQGPISDEALLEVVRKNMPVSTNMTAN
ncbi:hypothetical protein [Pseudoxanthomonas mexicana]|uniref:hypothetical protein n=1 Tax=Pseudoxanthomonas mexicana TaxID=128785 RepID=UPI0028AF7D8D|nr:hypothetical protein [Pseudoxanthomonas mexicana]MCR6627249.1 hypothetical protein [Pseudoxanthomonas sp.]